MTGLEPATSGTTTRRSSQLSYTHRRRLTILPKTVGGRLARLKGFEPLTRSLEGCRSIQLSYRRPTTQSSMPRAGLHSSQATFFQPMRTVVFAQYVLPTLAALLR